jgi:GNAT superfamily N-acetyltransferase
LTRGRLRRLIEAVRIETAEPGTAGFEGWVTRWYAPWCEAYEAGLAAGRRDPVLLTAPDRLAMLREPVATERRLILAAVADSEAVVGGVRVDLPLTDNRSLCWFELAVSPSARRCGVGTALLHAVRDLAVATGRTLLMTEVERPVDAAAGTWPGTAFAVRFGFTLGLASVRRALALPVDGRRAEALRRDAARTADGYSVVCFSGPVRAQDRDRMAALKARMSIDAPLDELDYEPEAWDADRVLEQERVVAAMGGTKWTAVAVAPDGQWAGFTDLVWTPNDPGRLHQWDTLVLREHRGHRLGLLLKLAALERATAGAPQARVVTTENAASNAHMIAINEAIGFRPTEVYEEWQAPVSQLA